MPRLHGLPVLQCPLWIDLAEALGYRPTYCGQSVIQQRLFCVICRFLNPVFGACLFIWYLLTHNRSKVPTMEGLMARKRCRKTTVIHGCWHPQTKRGLLKCGYFSSYSEVIRWPERKPVRLFLFERTRLIASAGCTWSRFRVGMQFFLKTRPFSRFYYNWQYSLREEIHFHEHVLTETYSLKTKGFDVFNSGWLCLLIRLKVLL